MPYVGTELPVWWEAFAEQARFNDGLVDWIIFCDKVSAAVDTYGVHVFNPSRVLAVLDSLLSRPSKSCLPGIFIVPPVLYATNSALTAS